MSDLHVFQFNGEISETVVARSIGDAWAVIKESIGHERADYEADVDFVQLEDNAKFKLAVDEEPKGCGFPSNDVWTKDKNGIWHAERTCAEWVALAGRGHLGSSEW